MATPVGDSHQVASGSVIAAGRHVAPVIVGSVWMPTRDGIGNVISTDWTGLPLNTWLDVAGATMESVIETPHYTAISGGDSSHAIIDAWGGAGWDATTNRMYLNGGGHGDSSQCETGIYVLDALKLSFGRVSDRQPLSQNQSWDSASQTFNDSITYPPCSIPLKNGVPSSWHTYNGVVFVPPAVMGNSNGGIYIQGSARSVYDLDSHTYSITHWNSPNHDALDWSNQAAFIDGSTIYAPLNAWYHHRFDLSQTEATDWNANSKGKWLSGRLGNTIISTSENAIWGTFPERREEVSVLPSGVVTRLRYGQAIDSASAVWDAYFDTITLTSSDGSHSEFNSTNLSVNGKLGQAGFCYDHPTQTLYLVPAIAGSEIYKISGIAGATWTVQKLVVSGSMRPSYKGLYGRCRIANISGKKVLVRVSSTTAPIQVMRLS